MLTRTRLATALGCLTLAAWWIAPAIAQQRAAPMTAQEKIQSWKGERVIVLSSVVAYHVKAVGRDGTVQPGDEQGPKFFGKSGVVVDVDVNLAGGKPFPKVRVALDDGQQVLTSEHSLGFYAEMEKAKVVAGKTLWTRGPLHLFPIGSSPERGEPDFSVPPAHMVKVVAADWGVFGRAVALRMRTSDGRDGIRYVGSAERVCFDERFYVTEYDGDAPCERTFASSRLFFEQDPRTLYPKWSKEIWALIDSQTVAIGMTEKMLDVLCGETLERTGATVSETGSVSTIYKCAGKEFLVDRGVVTKYATGFYR